MVETYLLFVGNVMKYNLMLLEVNFTCVATKSGIKLRSAAPCRNPMVTGTSVLGVKFTGGVIIAADMLGSYGSLARFRNISRLMKVS